MAKGTETQQTKTESSKTEPYAPAQPLLNDILHQLSGQNTAVTAGQTGALNNLQSAAGAIPNFGTAGAGTVSNLFNTSTAPQQGMLTGALDTFKGNLAPFLDPKYLDPMSNPGLKGALDTSRSDITNRINSQFAAAGRDLSPANSKALARGLSEGDSAILTDQYNKNVATQLGAAGSQFGASGTTAGGLTQQQLAALTAQTQGLGAASTIPGLFTQPAGASLAAANAAYGQPFGNIGMLSNLTTPIAGLGSQSQGTSQGTTFQPMNPWTTAAGTAIAAAPFIFSDERVKADIRPVGMLFDDTPVYSYRYKGDDKSRIGLIAQDVEKDRPDAVREFGGVKAVDYGKATERARMIGMLGLREAA